VCACQSCVPDPPIILCVCMSQVRAWQKRDGAWPCMWVKIWGRRRSGWAHQRTPGKEYAQQHTTQQPIRPDHATVHHAVLCYVALQCPAPGCAPLCRSMSSCSVPWYTKLLYTALRYTEQVKVQHGMWTVLLWVRLWLRSRLYCGRNSDCMYRWTCTHYATTMSCPQQGLLLRLCLCLLA